MKFPYLQKVKKWQINSLAPVCGGRGDELVDLRSVLRRVQEVEGTFVWGKKDTIICGNSRCFPFQKNIFFTCCHRPDEHGGELYDRAVHELAGGGR